MSMAIYKCPKCSATLVRGVALSKCMSCGVDLDSQCPDAQLILDMQRTMDASESEDWQAESNLPPNAGIYYCRRGMAYYNQGEYDQAVNNYSVAILLTRENHLYDSYCMRAFCYVEKGTYQPALKDLSIAIRLDPEDPTAWAQRGSTYEKLGRIAEAEADWNKSYDLEVEGKGSRWD